MNRFFLVLIGFFQAVALFGQNIENHPALSELDKLESLMGQANGGILGEQLTIIRQKIPDYRASFTKFLSRDRVKGLSVDFIAVFHHYKGSTAAVRILVNRTEAELATFLSQKPYDYVGLESVYGSGLKDIRSLYVFANQPLMREGYVKYNVDLSSYETFVKSVIGHPDVNLWPNLPTEGVNKSEVYIGSEDPALNALDRNLAYFLDSPSREKAAQAGLLNLLIKIEECAARLRSYFALSILVQRLTDEGKKEGALIYGSRHCEHFELMASYCSLTYRVKDMGGSYQYYKDNFKADQK